ncbi:MAG: hydrogenase maturation nickel metallochaperone HypA [Bacteroidales bacterium]|nr:hydrogenase maturation nickel metallochaperone HypA [Bacteroidales bacterium]
MHELSIASALSETVLETGLKGNLVKITRVNIAIGQLAQIVPEIFEFAFRECVRDTIASDAELDIEIINTRLKCRNCLSEFEMPDDSWGCMKCSSTELDIINGKELFVKSIEGEEDGNKNNEEYSRQEPEQG